MSEPIFYQHPSGHQLSVIRAESGFLLSAFHPASGRVVNGFERTIEDVVGWAAGLPLLFSEAEGSA